MDTLESVQGIFPGFELYHFLARDLSGDVTTSKIWTPKSLSATWRTARNCFFEKTELKLFDLRKIPSTQIKQTVLTSYRKASQTKIAKKTVSKKNFAKRSAKLEFESQKRVKNVAMKH